MVVSAAEATMAGQPSAVSPQQTAEHPPGVLAKPAYYKRFFKQLWTLLYHKQGMLAFLGFQLSSLCTSHYLLNNHKLSAARVAFRNRTSTLIRLVVAPFLFILLVYVIDKAISSGNQSIAGMESLVLQYICLAIYLCILHRKDKAMLLDSFLISAQDLGLRASLRC